MKESINFAWPVTSTNREDYEAFCEWLDRKKEIVEKKQIAIWGAGIRGTEFSLFFRKRNYHDIIFVDNNEQKWGGVIDEFPIISPEELYQKMMKEKAKILISAEASTDIEKQLQEKGYIKDKDFFTIKSCLYEKYVNEFEREYKGEILIMGDCEFSKISMKDIDLTNLGEMIKAKCGEDRTKVLAMHGMGLRAHYNVLNAQISNGMKPKVLLVMVNLDTLTGKHHLLPRSQHVELLRMVYNKTENRDEEFEEYMRVVEERSKNIQVEFFTHKFQTEGEKAKEIKAKNYFRINYMYNLNVETEGLVYLRKIFEKAREENIDVIPFVPPVNYTVGTKLLGEKFEVKYKQNLEKIRQIVEENKKELLDLSYCLGVDMFAEPETPDETANEVGRRRMTELLYEAIRKLV
ncbi:hypothetical protein [Roseburia sp. 499]|uniref:hypothetical protein n=1 Tax=Roseburia sp. 499 TaxID=1261634 RepID=UPI000952C314|nr:hypothetical protein [Roseburia sp. 499]WVK70038.1 hypothetical protein BIV20_00480 [Roseburia sp. 499]